MWLRADEKDEPYIFEHNFPLHRQLLPLRMFFVLYEDRVVGTGSAWIDTEDSYPGWGQLHSIAIVPEAQGKGIGTWLAHDLTMRLLELGHTQIYLQTVASRENAIAIYKKLGYEEM